MLTLNKKIHKRFEPEIDGGTTYAFSFTKQILVIGKLPMWKLLSTLERGNYPISFFMGTAIGSKNEEYQSIDDLLKDITRLVDSGVLSVEKD